MSQLQLRSGQRVRFDEEGYLTGFAMKAGARKGVGWSRSIERAHLLVVRNDYLDHDEPLTEQHRRAVVRDVPTIRQSTFEELLANMPDRPPRPPRAPRPMSQRALLKQLRSEAMYRIRF